MTADKIIIHHYPQSPVSEKIRVVLGLKCAHWRSVIIPRLPPKPNLMPLTGGYRLTPVMQIGADVYCDTKCIALELERRIPNPSLFLAGSDEVLWQGKPWTDDRLFTSVVNVALVAMSADMPAEFFADRGPLYFGPEFNMDTLKANYSDALAQVREQFAWLNDRLSNGAFVGGSEPSALDAMAYYLVWFLRARLPKCDAFMDSFEHLLTWEKTVQSWGHGTQETLLDVDALDIAAQSEPQTLADVTQGDPSGLFAGDMVSITPQTGGVSVKGPLHSLHPDRLSIMREDDQIGHVCVHFPRNGYVLKKV